MEFGSLQWNLVMVKVFEAGASRPSPGDPCGVLGNVQWNVPVHPLREVISGAAGNSGEALHTDPAIPIRVRVK